MDKTTWTLGLQTIKDQDPDHPLLAPIERAGYNAVSKAYMKKALDSLKIKTVNTKPKDDSILKRLKGQLSKLFIKRAKLSNSLHDCIDDNGRAAVSQNIGFIQKDIERKIREIDYYRDNKRLPVNKNSEEFPIPTNDYELAKLEASVKASILRGKRNLAKRRKEGKSTLRQEKFLNKSIEYADIIQRAIAEKGLH